MAGNPSREGRFADAVFFVSLTAAASLPFLLLLFPSVDGPSHVATGDIIRRLIAHDNGLAGSAFALRPFAVTNSFVHYLLAALLSVLPPRLADKVIVASLVWLMPFSVWVLARRQSCPNRWVLLALIPFGMTLSLQGGNYNFIFSFCFAFFSLAVWYGCRGWFSWRGFLLISCLWSLAAWAHPLGLGYAGACGGAMAMTLTACAWDRHQIKSAGLLRWVVRRWALPLIAAVPAAIIVALFIAHIGDVKGDIDYHRNMAGPGVLHRIRNMLVLRQIMLFRPAQIWNFSRSELILCLIFSAALAASVVICIGRVRERRLEERDAALAAGCVALLIYLFVPDGGAGADYLVGRLDAYPWLFVIVWLAWVPIPRIWRLAQACVIAAVGTGLWVENYRGLANLALSTKPYLAVLNEINPRSIVLPVVESGSVSGRAGAIFYHLFHYVGVTHSALMLNNWNAHNPGFPIEFRRQMNPYRYFNVFDLKEKNLDGFETSSGLRIGYVFLWWSRAELAKGGDPFLKQLSADYRLEAWAIGRNGMEAELFRRRKNHRPTTPIVSRSSHRL